MFRLDYRKGSSASTSSVVGLKPLVRFLDIGVFRLLCVRARICRRRHTCASPCVCSVSAWGSICVRLTRWEPLSAGSPGGPKSFGWPEAWNPSRARTDVSLFRPTQPSATSQTSRRRFGAEAGLRPHQLKHVKEKNNPPYAGLQKGCCSVALLKFVEIQRSDFRKIFKGPMLCKILPIFFTINMSL